jgi:hypothetical protein
MAPDAPQDVSAATVEQLQVAYDRADTEVRHHDGLLAVAALVFAVVLAAFGGNLQVERFFRLNSGFALLTGGLAFATVGLVVTAVARRRVAAAERRRRIAERLAAATETAEGIDTDPGAAVTQVDHEGGVDGGQTAGPDPEADDHGPEPTACDAVRESVDTETDGSGVGSTGGSLDAATAVAGVIVTVGAVLVALSAVVFAAWLNRLIPVYVPSSDQEFWLAVAIATVFFLVSVVALATLIVAGVDLVTDEGGSGYASDAVDSQSTDRGSR